MHRETGRAITYSSMLGKLTYLSKLIKNGNLMYRSRIYIFVIKSEHLKFAGPAVIPVWLKTTGPMVNRSPDTQTIPDISYYGYRSQGNSLIIVLPHAS